MFRTIYTFSLFLIMVKRKKSLIVKSKTEQIKRKSLIECSLLIFKIEPIIAFISFW